MFVNLRVGAVNRKSAVFVNLPVVGAVNRKSVVFVNFPPIVHPHMVRVDKSFTAGRPLSPPSVQYSRGRGPHPSDPGRVENREPRGGRRPPINYVSARRIPTQEVGYMVHFPRFVAR